MVNKNRVPTPPLIGQCKDFTMTRNPCQTRLELIVASVVTHRRTRDGRTGKEDPTADERYARRRAEVEIETPIWAENEMPYNRDPSRSTCFDSQHHHRDRIRRRLSVAAPTKGDRRLVIPSAFFFSAFPASRLHRNKPLVLRNNA